MTLKQDRHTLEPYKLLFPVSLLGAVLTVGVWMLAALKPWTAWPLPAYPGDLHAYGVFATFVFPAVSGFLLTAVPRFTGTALPITAVSTFIAFLYLISILGFFLGSPPLVVTGAFLALLYTLWFAGRRLAKSAVPPPAFLMAFIPAGLASAVLGWALILMGWLLALPETAHLQPNYPLALAGRTLLFYYSISLIILGAGSRIAVTIQAADHEDKNDWRRSLEQATLEPYLLSALVAVAAILEFSSLALEKHRTGALHRVGAFLLFAALFYWLVLRFRIYRNSFRRAISTGLWSALWMILAGMALRAFTGSASVHWSHLFFAGGLALLTISVMTRVILSHGKWDLMPENRSPILWAIIGLLLFAAATRASAHLLPSSYLNHLGYAALLFVAAVILWIVRFLRLAWKDNSS